MNGTQSSDDKAAQIINKLGLVPHPEGGYFWETYRGGSEPMKSKGRTTTDGKLVNTEMLPCWDDSVPRHVMTSIYWLMTRDSNPIFHWVINKSDHVHYWQGGNSIVYHMISADGKHSTQRLGGQMEDILEKDATPQVVVEGGTWKAAVLDGDYCLVGEGVAPGFDFGDFGWVTQDQLYQRVGKQKGKHLAPLLKENASYNFDEFYNQD